VNRASETSQKSLNQRSWRGLIALGFVFLMFGFLFLNTLYEETIGKQNLVIQVHGFQFGALFSDQGTFKLYEPTVTRTDRALKRLFGNEPFNLLFWRDRAGALRSHLRFGCHYEVTVINALFDDHPLGENRMPPQTTVVKVDRRIEATEHECDVSADSGKPVCRWDQVRAVEGEGVFLPADAVCDFETFLNVRKSLPGKPSWEQ
jgi:hypothetical protein